MRNPWMLTTLAAFCALAVTAARVTAQAVQPTSETYTWSGEMVAFDAATHALTVKAPVYGEQARAMLPQIKAGDRIVLTWSGFDNFTDGISRAVRYEHANAWKAPFTFPVEYVAYEQDRHYLTFTTQVPAGSIDAVKSVKPGEWLTATARHRPTTDQDILTVVKAYGAPASTQPSTD